MNFRHTALLFGLCFGMLWLFGLMLAYKKVSFDESLIVPTLQKAEDLDVDTVIVQRQPSAKESDKGKPKEPEEYTFDRVNDYWVLKAGGQSIRVEGYRIKTLVQDIKNLKKNDNADVNARDLAFYELNRPQITVTIRGKLKKTNQEKTWKFMVGKESVDNLFAYVNSSDRPNRVFAVDRAKIEGLYFQDINALRSKRLFDYSATSATGVAIKKGAEEIELAKGEDGAWRFVKPAGMGFADYEGADSKLPALPGAKSEGGVQGLISAISHIQVEKEADFLPPGDLSIPGLEDGKETMRITVSSPSDKKDQKELSRETLLIGRHIDKSNQYYARLATDQGAFKINDKYLEPVLKVLNKPGELRSMDVLPVDTKNVDYISLFPGGQEIKLSHAEGKSWLMQQGTSKPEQANDKAVQDLLETLQGKKKIHDFVDVAESDAKKQDELLGLATPAAEVSLYVNALEKPKKDEKKDEKDDKKAEKKDLKKETAKDKDEQPATLVKDAKPTVKLAFGKVEGDYVYVKRTLQDGAISRFKVAKAMIESVRPPDARLAFLKTSLPEFDLDNVVRFDLQRGANNLELEYVSGQWAIKGTDPTGPQALTRDVVFTTMQRLHKLQPKRWVKKPEAKDDPEQWGLKTPAATVTLVLKKANPKWAATLTSLLADATVPWGAVGAYLGAEAKDKGETVTYKFGKETDQEKDKPGVFAQYSGTDLIFLASPDELKVLREFDPRNKNAVTNFQAMVDASLLALTPLNRLNSFLFASPLAANQVVSFDPAQVKAVDLTVRTPEELRTFRFAKDKDNKTWKDESGLKEFSLDSDKVKQLVEEVSKLQADRLVSFGGPKADHKLSPLEAKLRMEIFLQDGKSITYTVGGLFAGTQHFAHSTSWPEVVYFIDAVRVAPLLRGVGYFAKERPAGQ